MESLYRKYRPQTFADVVGQQHVVGTLERAVLEGRVSHAYLFCGPRGTGKTTMARLLAKALMCEQGPGQLPDGTCHQCELIAAGEHPDVYELDAASRTGVDNVREEIINRVSYAPVQGRYKIYVIDEVHMLTTAAFNALLKTLEEPPAHVVFVLCTTDPQKIPATILSRVQRFDFRPIGSDDIHARLAYVCEQEGFTYEDAALELVVRQARGGMRDALSALEKLSVFGEGTIALEAAQDLLGAVPGAALDEVMSAMAARDIAALFGQVGTLVDSGRDLLQFTRELAARVRDTYVVAIAGANLSVLPAGSDPQVLQREAATFGTPDRLARILTLLGDVSREMATAPNQRLVLEIAFTRIARPETDLTLESLSERVAELEKNAGKIVLPVQPVESPQEQPAPQPVPQPQVTAQPVQAPPAQPQQAPRPRNTQARTPQRPTQQPRPVQPAQAAPQPAATPQAAPQNSGFQRGELQRRWKQVVAQLVAQYPARGSLLSSAMPTSDDGNELVIGLPKGSTFALKMLERPDVRQTVEGLVREVFGPRTLVYKEGIGQDLKMPRAAQTQAAPQVATPRAATPAPRTEPQPAPEPTPAPAPVSTPAAPSYPMPWEEPVAAAPAAPSPAPQAFVADQGYGAYDNQPVPDEYYYEPVPYDDVDVNAYYGADMGAAPFDSQPAPEPEPQAPAVPQNPIPQNPPAPPVPQQEQPSAPKAEATPPAPEPKAEEKPAAKADHNERPERSVQVDEEDLPDDLRAVLENAFMVFGEDIDVSKDA